MSPPFEITVLEVSKKAIKYRVGKSELWIEKDDFKYWTIVEELSAAINPTEAGS